MLFHFSPSATIRRVGSHTHSASTGTENDPTLSKTLFVRLAAAGIVPLMLARQYRLHPHLSALPNRLFYQQRLSNGVAASDRAALIPHLPPLSFIEIPNGREMLSGPGGSFVNSEECHAVTQLSSALAHHVDASDIGIISLCAFNLSLAFSTCFVRLRRSSIVCVHMYLVQQTRRKLSKSKRPFAPLWWQTVRASCVQPWTHSRAQSACVGPVPEKIQNAPHLLTRVFTRCVGSYF